MVCLNFVIMLSLCWLERWLWLNNEEVETRDSRVERTSVEIVMKTDTPQYLDERGDGSYR